MTVVRTTGRQEATLISLVPTDGGGDTPILIYFLIAVSKYLARSNSREKG